MNPLQRELRSGIQKFAQRIHPHRAHLLDKRAEAESIGLPSKDLFQHAWQFMPSIRPPKIEPYPRIQLPLHPQDDQSALKLAEPVEAE